MLSLDSVTDWTDFDKKFIEMGNAKNKEFSTKIVNTKMQVLGIYIPEIRKLSKTATQKNLLKIIDKIQLNFYEKTILKALLITQIKDKETALLYAKNFVPKIDNWSTCDIFCGDFKIVGKNKEFFEPFINDLLASNQEFEQRVGVVLLMKYYLNAENLPQILDKIRYLNFDFYYVNMAVAWLLSEAYLLDKNVVIKCFFDDFLPKNTKIKAISKICDSFRVSKEDKDCLRSLRKEL